GHAIPLFEWIVRGCCKDSSHLWRWLVGHLLHSTHKDDVVEAGHYGHYATAQCGAGGGTGVLDPHCRGWEESSPAGCDRSGMGLVFVCLAHLSDEGCFDVLTGV